VDCNELQLSMARALSATTTVLPISQATCLMPCRFSIRGILIGVGAFLAFADGPSRAGGGLNSTPAYRVQLDTGHSWRPPFGLDRVGRPVIAVVEASAPAARSGYRLTANFRGRAAANYPVRFPKAPPYSARVVLDVFADEVVLSNESGSTELLRQSIRLPEIEADALARPETVINPVDLGTILVPSGWLLLGPGQSATLELAALSRSDDVPRAVLKAAFGSMPKGMVSAPVALAAGRVARHQLRLSEFPRDRDRDVLNVALDDGAGRIVWQKSIPVMLVSNPPQHPQFGATYERLRYDAPISIRDPATGAYSRLPYENGWKPELRDVVVWLPDGGRFVFWRGSSFIPFWASRHNTGLCYEWAEIISQPKGAVDCVEPLMDKELRYGTVEIVESTQARVHVRWGYQSTDFNYRVWGDAAVEDYYFYPDGFGTRVVNLRADAKNDYELSEFIILTPQGAYPLDVLPQVPVEALFLDGRKTPFRLPNPTGTAPPTSETKSAKEIPAIYRLRMSDRDTLAAVYFNPNETKLPPVVFAPFFDQGQMVTPCYWGSHWPLARGNSTGRTIDERIALTPCHNSVMSWGGCRPKPLVTAELVTLDTLGRSRPMVQRRWAWLIGMTDEPDGRLLDRARSFAAPPSLKLEGARLDFDAYAPERRAICMTDRSSEITLTIEPAVPCVNPVFEWNEKRKGGIEVFLDDRPLTHDRFAWDGRVLWLSATIERPTRLRIRWDLDPAKK
jgi:hypothetical protein